MTAQTVAWKLAARSRLVASVLSELSHARATAVFSPAKEKSAPCVPDRGLGRRKAPASPPSAQRSTCGPPGKPRPITLAVLSKASPAASSSVEPSRR